VAPAPSLRALESGREWVLDFWGRAAEVTAAHYVWQVWRLHSQERLERAAEAPAAPLEGRGQHQRSAVHSARVVEAQVGPQERSYLW